MDKGIQLITGKVNRRDWSSGLFAAERGRSGDLASARELESGLQTELPSFFNRNGFVANGKICVRIQEKTPVDGMCMVNDDLLKSRDFKFLEFAQGKCFDFGKIPLVGEP